ncbi:hypothetical protein E2C01_056685 [Portunus trituberculatus]|uniref:Uncharacterized protein n=1 Tax=Portunus trituberculatus TaxID=210409 RepID=A0A5B7H098_PORTR|nr:hypothetical protein [Portunus trituberculatus]
MRPNTDRTQLFSAKPQRPVRGGPPTQVFRRQRNRNQEPKASSIRQASHSLQNTLDTTSKKSNTETQNKRRSSSKIDGLIDGLRDLNAPKGGNHDGASQIRQPIKGFRHGHVQKHP